MSLFNVFNLLIGYDYFISRNILGNTTVNLSVDFSYIMHFRRSAKVFIHYICFVDIVNAESFVPTT